MDRRLLRRVLAYARPYRWLLWLVLATIILAALVGNLGMWAARRNRRRTSL